MIQADGFDQNAPLEPPQMRRRAYCHPTHPHTSAPTTMGAVPHFNPM